MIEDFPATLAAAQAGEEWAVAVLWRDLNHRVVRFLSARAGNAAEDIASETWLSAARKLHEFSGGEIEFRAWMFTIARRRFIDWQRCQHRRPDEVNAPLELEHHPAGDDPAVDVIEAINTEAALALISQLSSDQADVILLRVLAGLDVAQVAAIVGRKPGTVRVLQHRGLHRLRELLASFERDELGVTR
jgi:RNA polymerase sigma-70 factor (ECF subfamily)